MFRFNVNDIYNPVYQDNVTSTSETFTASYNLLSSPVSTTEVGKYRVISAYIKGFETCSEYNQQG